MQIQTSTNAKENLETLLKQQKLVLVDFFASWCGPCKLLAPVIEKVAQEYEKTLDLLKIDIDQNPEIAAEYNIKSVPTVILFKNGEVVVRQTGAMSFANYAKLIEENS